METQAQKEHLWLQKFLGEWTYEGECPGAPGEPPMQFKGTESARAIGELWIQSEGSNTTPDGKPATMLLTLGYDPVQKAYVGTWIGSMMSHLWVYKGTLDTSGKVLTLDTEGPSMAGDGKMVRYQDITTFVDDNHRTLTSQTLGEDGKWNHFMTMHLYRSVE